MMQRFDCFLFSMDWICIPVMYQRTCDNVIRKCAKPTRYTYRVISCLSELQAFEIRMAFRKEIKKEKQLSVFPSDYCTCLDRALISSVIFVVGVGLGDTSVLRTVYTDNFVGTARVREMALPLAFF